jgi:diaminopimelate epimerase
MEPLIPFYKYHGAGNDFIVINNDDKNPSPIDPELFKRMCDRHFGIGADGVMLIDTIRENHFNLRYFNANGSEAPMCGNGARCAVSFVHKIQPESREYSFQIGNLIYRAEIIATDNIKIFWEVQPQIQPVEELSSIVPSDFSDFLVVDSGVPHLVLFYEGKLETVNLKQWGPFFRNHPLFSPEGTNVNVITINENKIYIRTYERGVERETLACGTGMLAAAIAGEYRNKIKLPVELASAGGILMVGTQAENKMFWLQGPAKQVFSGEFNPINL